VIANGEWTRIASLPRKLSVFACSALNTSFVSQASWHLVLHGGEVDPSTSGHSGAGEFSSQTFAFDGNDWQLISTHWTEGCDEAKPSSRGWHVSAFDPTTNTFFVHGGNLENNIRTNELWTLSAEQS
jgi:hypothetical protein